MKTIAVFGASGLTASECVYQALANGDTVVGLTRNPSNLVIPKGSGGSKAGEPLTNPNLTLIGGDVTKMADVEKVFSAAGKVDGVVVALGGKTSDVGDTMLRDGTANVLAAMKANDVKRVAVVTSIGTGDSEKQAPFFFKILMMTVRFNDNQGTCFCILRGCVAFSLLILLFALAGHEEDLCRQKRPRKGCCRKWLGILHCPSGWFDGRSSHWRHQCD